MVSNNRKVLFAWIGGVVLVWEVVAFILAIVLKDPQSSAKLPFLHTILWTFIQNGGSLFSQGLMTLSRSGLGFLMGAMVGIILAILMSLFQTIERIAFPYLLISQMIPILGLAPIIFNLVRDMDTARIVIAAYITFFPVSVNMLSGLKSVEPEKLDLMFSYAARTPVTYAKLMLPYSLPYLFAGLKIAAPLSVTASILVDMLGSKNGIGVMLLYSLYGGQREIFWASVIMSALMGIASFYLVAALEKPVIPWNRSVFEKEGAT